MSPGIYICMEKHDFPHVLATRTQFPQLLPQARDVGAVQEDRRAVSQDFIVQSWDAARRPRETSESPGTVARDPLLSSESITAIRILVIVWFILL